ncbi:hypothetical protein [Parasediminibacterium sp. JCM 36343]|uniref:hypothetical protein n=1 Tax=Parasediminibacterium sp. JCM 36343 TaxID=3374279 RepID=UPI003979EA8D
MRKIAFIDTFDELKKLMIYESQDGIYLFGYDCVQDSSSLWDYQYLTVQEAEKHCFDNYQIDKEKWISVSEPLEDCQHDFIMPTRVIGKKDGKPIWGQFEVFENGKWIEISYPEKYLNFGGMTGNERLWVSGLMTEFETSKHFDKTKARLILTALQFESNSIDIIIQ